MSQIWQVRLSDQAELDLIAISHWTAENFGPHPAEQYVETLLLAIDALGDGPRPLEARVRSELGAGVHTLQVTRQGRKGRHFVVYRVIDEKVLDVLRVLHDSMDLVRHLPSTPDYSQ